MQDTLARGQIKYIKLKSHGATKWTLLYSHRRFRGIEIDQIPLYASQWGVDSRLKSRYPEAANPSVYEIDGYSFIDRIYVYEGDIADSLLAKARLEVNHLDTPNFLMTTGQEPLTQFNAGESASSQLPTNWRYQVRYHYGEPEPINNVGPAAENGGAGTVKSPLLRMSSVRTRTSAVSNGSSLVPEATESISRTLFVYAPRNEGYLTNALPWLRMIFTEDDLGRLFRARSSLGLTTGPLAPSWLDEERLALWRYVDGTSLDTNEESANKIRPFASIRWEWTPYSQWTSGDDPYCPSIDALRSSNASGRAYLSIDSPECWNDGRTSQTVGYVAFGAPDGEQQRVYRLHRLIVPPDASSPSFSATLYPSQQQWRAPEQSIFHHPYLWQSTVLNPGLSPGGVESLLPFATSAPNALSKSRWISIVDEFSGISEWSRNYDVSSGNKIGQRSRRVVEMNPAGFVLRDRTWTLNPLGTSGVLVGGGLGEQNVFKRVSEVVTLEECAGLSINELNETVLVERRSVGWSAADLAGQGATDGLIDFFNYKYTPSPSEAAPGGKRLEIVAQGIQRGTASTPPGSSQTYSAKRLVVYNEATNTESVITIEFTQPVFSSQYALIQPPSTIDLAYLDGLAAAGLKANVTMTLRSTVPDPQFPDQPARERRVIKTLVIGTPRQVYPQSPWYYPVEKQWLSDTGSVDWSASGLVRNPFSPASAADSQSSLVMTYYQRFTEGHGSGMNSHIIVDASLDEHETSVINGSGQRVTVVVSAWPEAGWQRMGTTRPINAITSFLYDSLGLSDQYFPTGLQWARRGVVVDRTLPPLGNPAPLPTNIADTDGEPLIYREYIFNDLRPVLANGQVDHYVSDSPGTVQDYATKARKGAPVLVRRVTFTGNVQIDSTNLAATPYENLSLAKLTFSSSGRVSKADQLEWVPGRGWEVIGTKEINDLGEVYRELELDGNITRITRNSIGQNLRKYTGTADLDWQQPTAANARYNMALVERYSYGSGSHDAWQPTVTRRYQANPSWHLDHYGTPPAIDPDGNVTQTQYDWRMRAVRTDTYTRGEPGQPGTTRESTTLTYLDYLSRPRLVVTLGRGELGTLPSTLDPVTFGVNATVPSPSDFFSLLIRPSSITETVYGPDGSSTERRTYDTAWTGSGTLGYHAEYQFNGRAGKECFSQRPGQAATITTIDGLGRVASTATGTNWHLDSASNTAVLRELTRTDYVYDRFNNVIETARWERVKETGDSLDLTNAVRTRTVSWYDAKNRVVATADLGTEQTGGYIAGAQQFVRYVAGSIPTADWHAATPSLDLTNGLTSNIDGLSNAAVTIHVFNKQGNESHTRLPNGTVTVSTFSSTNRLLSRTEDAYAPETSRRRTEYTYSIGRVSEIKANRTAADVQISRVSYGAEILARIDLNGTLGYSWIPVSRSNALIGAMHLPDPDTGKASLKADYFYRYTFQGQVAERIDASLKGFRYYYDDAERLRAVEVGYYWDIDSLLTFPGGFISGYQQYTYAWNEYGAPGDRIGYVEYDYDADGRMRSVRAYNQRATPRQLITENRCLYNQRGDLISEYQSLGVALPVGNTDPLLASIPAISYGWHYAPTNPADPMGPNGESGHNRLTSMTYPQHAAAGITSRILNLQYGSAYSVDDKLSRPTLMTGKIGTAGALSNIASFGYVGTTRRTSTRLGEIGGVATVTQDFGASTPVDTVGVSGLDPFGRPAKLNYTNSMTPGASGSVLFGADYTYDVSGNRTTAKVTQAATGTGRLDGNNRRSQLNAYDGFDRLIGTQTGRLTTARSDQPASVSQLSRQDTWQMDLLGNWSGRLGSGSSDIPEAAGHWITVQGQPQPAVQSLSYLTDERNQLRAIKLNNPTANPVVGAVNDAAGNLVYDTNYVYQYDAWNRLVAVYGSVIEQGVSVEVWPEEYWQDDLGDWYFSFDWGPGSYYFFPDNADGWNGRKGWINGPITLSATDDPAAYHVTLQFQARVAPTTLIKRYTYDGLGRLVKAVATDAVTPSMTYTERFLYDGVRRVQELVTRPVGVGYTTLVSNLAREYVWGPGDSFAGLDELLLQYAVPGGASSLVTRNKPYFVLQDAGGDVVALVNKEPNAPASVAAQYTYDAYGQVITAETLLTHPPLHAGHKALFFDNPQTPLYSIPAIYLDHYITLSFSDENPVLADGLSFGFYQMRNRVYSPLTGRFMQRDPNATSLTLIESVASLGRSLVTTVSTALPKAFYNDGINLHQYAKGNAHTNHDPFGLFLGTVSLGLGMAYDSWSTADGSLQDALDGVRTSLNLAGMLAQYQLSQSADADWASDLKMPDDMYSSSGHNIEVSDQSDSEHGPAIARSTSVAGRGNLGKGVSRARYNAYVKQYSRSRMQYWEAEMKAHPNKYSDTQKSRVASGRAPLGSDNHPMEIHHRKPLSQGGTNKFDNLVFMTRTDHRLGDNFRKNHPELFR